MRGAVSLMMLFLVVVLVSVFTMPALAGDIGGVPADDLKQFGQYAGFLAWMALEAWLGKTNKVNPGSTLGVVWAILKTVAGPFIKKPEFKK